MRLHAHPVFDEPEVRALANEAMAATSRLFKHLLEHHPALIRVANRDGLEVFRTLAVRHDSLGWDFSLEEKAGDHAQLEVVAYRFELDLSVDQSVQNPLKRSDANAVYPTVCWIFLCPR
jgi:hypothetical protein